jgi:transcriptional regulator with XRE-family HTH domain
MHEFQGALLRAQIAQSGKSMEQIAVDTDLSYHTIRRFLRDEIRPSLASFGRLVVALGCRPTDLLVETDEPTRRETDLGAATDAWIEAVVAGAPDLTAEQAKRISAALFSRAVSA